MPGDGATFPRLHVWSSNETILPIDLNAEFDNILNNLTFEGLDDYELNVNQMRLQTNPGGVGTESLATSGAGEIERIRYVLARIQGTTYWYEGAPISLTQANTLLQLSVSIPPNRLDSGVPLPLVASASTNSVTLDASPTPFNFHVSGTAYTASADATFSGLTLGSAAVTSKVLVNDVTLTGQTSSKVQGENNTVITFDTDGTHTGVDIVARIGKLSAFRITHLANTEYFIATVASSTTLTDAYRGYFFDSSGNPINRIAIFDNDPITLMELAYVFVTTGGSLAVTYNAPTYSAVQPTIAFAGDYWLDFTVSVWKTFNGSSWVTANATFLGLAIQDDTKTVGTRAAEYFAGYNTLNEIVLIKQDATHIIGKNIGEQINVAGHTYAFVTSVPSWASTGQFAAGAVLAPNTTYYAYVTNQGFLLLDTIPPYDRTKDLLGFYHPYNLWRAVGFFATDGASLFLTPTTYSATPAGQGEFNKITGDQIALATVSGANIAPATIGTGNIANGVITSALITDGTIVGGDIASNTITSGNILNGTIVGGDLAANINLPGVASASGFELVTLASATGLNLRFVRGATDGAGTIFAGEGFSWASLGVGYRRITYNIGMQSTAIPIVSLLNPIAQGHDITVLNATSASFEVIISDSGGTPVDGIGFFFISLG